MIIHILEKFVYNGIIRSSRKSENSMEYNKWKSVYNTLF